MCCVRKKQADKVLMLHTSPSKEVTRDSKNSTKNQTPAKFSVTPPNRHPAPIYSQFSNQTGIAHKSLTNPPPKKLSSQMDTSKTNTGGSVPTRPSEKHSRSKQSSTLVRSIFTINNVPTSVTNTTPAGSKGDVQNPLQVEPPRKMKARRKIDGYRDAKDPQYRTVDMEGESWESAKVAKQIDVRESNDGNKSQMSKRAESDCLISET